MPDRHGPLRTDMFLVEIDDVEVPGWTSAKLPASSTEPSDSGWGETIDQDLELERVVQADDTLVYDWKEDVRSDDEEEGLRTVVVILYNEEGQPEIQWKFTNAWPAYYQPPQLGAASTESIARERVVLAYESMERQSI